MKRYLILAVLAAVVMTGCKNPAKSGFPQLDEWAKYVYEVKTSIIGYPCTQYVALQEYYEWYTANKLGTVAFNNVGDPFASEGGIFPTSSTTFEREVLDWFAPYYGYEQGKYWGLVSNSGTDGNNHGIYFGVNYLYGKTGQMPIFYVSDEAHYSNMRLADLQNLDLCLIPSDTMGRMIPEELEKRINPNRPCLIVYAMGSTLKGAIDDQAALNAVLAKFPKMEVYRHVDAALFGGYLPFTEYKDLLNQEKMGYQSIAISAHKFFGSDEPGGLFFTSKEVYDGQTRYDIPYLNQNMKMINCSRSTQAPLKFWWLIHKVGADCWTEQAKAILEETAYFDAKLNEIGYPHWINDLSNTIVLKRPNEKLMKKYTLAAGYDDKMGGEVCHLVVMQHVDKKLINQFVYDLQNLQ